MDSRSGSQTNAAGLLVGYARVSTDEQDVHPLRDGVELLGVRANRIHVDHGRAGKHRCRKGLDQAHATCRAGDTLVETKLDRRPRSVRDATDVADKLAVREMALSFGESIHNPTDPTARLLFNVLSMVSELEKDVISRRTRGGMAVAGSRRRLKGKPPRLSAAQHRQVVRLMDEEELTSREIGDLSGVSRQIVYRVSRRHDRRHGRE